MTESRLSEDSPTTTDPVAPGHRVSPEVYVSATYLTKERWCSLWHQLDLVSKLKPRRMLEVGVGSGLVRYACERMGVEVRTVDFSPDLEPDLVATVRNLPLEDESFDLACAFQVLEHLPYEESLEGFRELCRVSSRHVVISLPNASPALAVSFTVPFLGSFRRVVPGPLPPLGTMTPSHRWEIGRPGFGLRRVVADLRREARLVSQFRVPEMPYHHFFHFERA